MKTSNFRHKVFCMAYELMKATGKAFAVCLSRAWKGHEPKVFGW